MRFKTARELLDRTHDFHQQASAYYRSLAATSHKHRVRYLLDYLAKHEQTLAESISRYEKDAPPSVLNAWFDEAPELDLHEALANLQLHDGLDVEDIIQIGMHLGDYLIWAYENLAEQAESEEVKEAFSNLAHMALSEKRLLSRDSQAMQDL